MIRGQGTDKVESGVITAIVINALNSFFSGSEDSCVTYFSTRHVTLLKVKIFLDYFRISVQQEFFSSLKIVVSMKIALTKMTPDFPFVSLFHLFTFPPTFQPDPV